MEAAGVPPAAGDEAGGVTAVPRCEEPQAVLETRLTQGCGRTCGRPLLDPSRITPSKRALIRHATPTSHTAGHRVAPTGWFRPPRPADSALPTQLRHQRQAPGDFPPVAGAS